MNTPAYQTARNQAATGGKSLSYRDKEKFFRYRSSLPRTYYNGQWNREE